MKVMFLDESGDHNLEKIDKQYPVFVLAGVVFDFKYYSETARALIKDFKREVFQDDKIIIHTADIYRNRGVFERMKKSDFREAFYKKINKIIADLNFEVLAVGILKESHKDNYGVFALDPYLLSLEFLVERFVFSLDKSGEKGMVVAESRGRQLDNQLEIAWLNLKVKGTRFVRPERLVEKITDFKIVKKSEMVEGLEVADLMASPIGRFLINKEIKEDFQIIKQKFRKGRQGQILGYGLIIFPGNGEEFFSKLLNS